MAVTLLLVNNAMAQEGLAFGLRVNPTMNWVAATPTNTAYSVESAGVRGGIAFGPSLRYGFSDNFNMDLTAIFSWQRFAIEQKGEVPALAIAKPVNNTENFKLQYLQFPLNLNGQFGIADNVKALINFGFGVNIKLKDERKVDYNSKLPPPYIQDNEYRETKVITPVDIFLMAGAGFGYDFADNLHLTLTIQYQNGLLDGWHDSKNEKEVSTILHDELKLNHRSVNFNLGFYIDF